MTTYLHRPEHERWCELLSAHPGGRIVTLCRDAIGYTRVLVATEIATERRCPACVVERRREERVVEIRMADLGGES